MAQPCELFFRVTAQFDTAEVLLKKDGEVIRRTVRRKLMPSVMERLKLNPADLPADGSSLTVEVRERNTK